MNQPTTATTATITNNGNGNDKDVCYNLYANTLLILLEQKKKRFAIFFLAGCGAVRFHAECLSSVWIYERERDFLYTCVQCIDSFLQQ